MECPNCLACVPEPAPDCSGCGVVFAKWREKAERLRAANALIPPEAAVAPPLLRDALQVPAAVFAIAWILVWTDWGRFLIQAGLSMQLHELGHAMVNWLGGRFAVPIPMLTISFSQERSALFALAVTAGLGLLLKLAWDEGNRALAGLCMVLLILQAWLTLFVSLDKLDFWVAFGGLGGECVIAALLVAAYLHPLPRAARWPQACAAGVTPTLTS